MKILVPGGSELSWVRIENPLKGDSLTSPKRMKFIVADAIDGTEHAGEDRSIANRFNGIANVGINL
jgi:hypothetical protein